MFATKYLVSTVAAIAVVGTIGLATAQTDGPTPVTPPTYTPMPTTSAPAPAPVVAPDSAQGSMNNTPAPLPAAEPMPARAPVSESSMTPSVSSEPVLIERPAQADRN